MVYGGNNTFVQLLFELLSFAERGAHNGVDAPNNRQSVEKRRGFDSRPCQLSRILSRPEDSTLNPQRQLVLNPNV
jgi:hypothetical protein